MLKQELRQICKIFPIHIVGGLKKGCTKSCASKGPILVVEVVEPLKADIADHEVESKCVIFLEHDLYARCGTDHVQSEATARLSIESVSITLRFSSLESSSSSRPSSVHICPRVLPYTTGLS